LRGPSRGELFWSSDLQLDGNTLWQRCKDSNNLIETHSSVVHIPADA
jgi:hypothetical protein